MTVRKLASIAETDPIEVMIVLHELFPEVHLDEDTQLDYEKSFYIIVVLLKQSLRGFK